MKKTLKKIGAALLVAAFLAVNLVPAMGAFAADQVKGSITVNNTVDGKYYNIYRIFDLTYQGKGDDKKVSYTIAAKWKPFFQTGGEGAKYLKDENNTENSLNPILVKEGAGSKIKYINITDENIKDFSKDALKFLRKVEAEGTQKATGTTLEFQNLPFGYYLVYPKGASTIIDPSQDKTASIVSITSAAPAGEVNVKSTYPTITKEADKVSADYGDPITFTLTGKVPDTTGYSKYAYDISDTLSDGLDFIANTVTVKIGNDVVASNAAENPVTNGNITISQAGRKLAINFDMLALNKAADTPITVTYQAKLNKDATIGKDGANNANKVVLTYSNDPKDSTSTDTTPEQKKIVYTASITVDKHDSNNENKKLPGAIFVLKKGDQYYKYDETSQKVTWVDKDQATQQKTGSNGQADFKGIADGDYELVEIQAPEGYNLLKDPVPVKIEKTDSKDTRISVVGVANSSGKELPGTGGMGAKLFIVIGGGIGLLAAGMYRRSRKMNAGNR